MRMALALALILLTACAHGGDQRPAPGEVVEGRRAHDAARGVVAALETEGATPDWARALATIDAYRLLLVRRAVRQGPGAPAAAARAAAMTLCLGELRALRAMPPERAAARARGPVFALACLAPALVADRRVPDAA